MGVPGSVNNLLGAGGAPQYLVERSLRFNSSDSAYLSRTPASAGNRKTWTWAGWVKRSELSSSGVYPLMTSYVDTQNYSVIDFQNDTLRVVTGTTGVGEQGKKTTQIFRDPSSWYHIVIASDNLSTLKIYVNGSEVTAFSTNATVTADWHFNTTNPQWIGREQYSTSNNYFSGYLADVHFIDGQALTPSSFTEVSATTGQLIPKAYTGSFGTNGFWLKFSDNSAATATTLGKDYSGNSNNFTPNNLSVTAGAGNDSLVDTPTSYGTDTGAGGEVRGNYCTLNPLNRDSNANLSNGNLNFSLASSGTNYGTFATFGVRTGKWYFEASIDSFISYGITTGFVTSNWGKDYIGSGGTAYFGLDTTGGRRSSAGITAAGSTVTYGAGDVVGVAFDADAGTATIYKNGASVYTFSGIPANDYFPALSSGGSSAWINFGQRPFAYTAPSGFKALCDTNLPAPVVAKPNTAFDVALWTGNGSARSITGLNFNPDFVWIKGRSGATDHALYDVVRGTEKRLESNTTDAEVTSDGGVTAFNGDGFSLGTLAQVNTNSSTYVGWAWDGGTSTVTNTQGSITSQVRANASAGFSIVTYTGNGSTSQTVGHGLGVKPGLIIVKSRSNGTWNWGVYHQSLSGSTPLLSLNTTGAANNLYDAFNPANNSSAVFGIGNEVTTNQSSGTYVAYCFAPVTGLSAFGSYTGNGSADGPMIYTGFRPAVVIVKMSSSTGDWTILDDKREGYNVDNDPLYPNLSNAEGTTDLIDITSNGFKVRTTDASFNTNAGTYVYAAWASAPFQYARAR